MPRSSPTGDMKKVIIGSMVTINRTNDLPADFRGHIQITWALNGLLTDLAPERQACLPGNPSRPSG